MQCTDDEIAGLLRRQHRGHRAPAQGPTVQRRDGAARAKGRVSVRRNLFRLASTGNVAASIFLAKNLLGCKDVVANEVSGPDGRPIPIESRPDLSNLSDEELKNFSEKAQPKTKRISAVATSETKLASWSRTRRRTRSKHARKANPLWVLALSTPLTRRKSWRRISPFRNTGRLPTGWT